MYSSREKTKARNVVGKGGKKNLHSGRGFELRLGRGNDKKIQNASRHVVWVTRARDPGAVAKTKMPPKKRTPNCSLSQVTNDEPQEDRVHCRHSTRPTWPLDLARPETKARRVIR